MSKPKMDETRQIVTVNSKRCRSKCSFKWEISDFDTVCPKNSIEIQRITSPAFTAGDDIGQKTQWCVSVAGINGDVTISLYRLSALAIETHAMLCKYKISIGNSLNDSIISARGEHKFKQEEGGWGCEILKVPAIYEIREPHLLQGNKMKLSLQMEIGANMDCNISISKSNPIKFDPLTMESLQQDMRSLFQSRDFSDVKIKCGDQVFHCHKLILSVRSKVLKTMLETNMAESTLNEIIIQDIEPTTIQVILEYIYTGKFELPAKCSWPEVIHGAEKYDLMELKNFCFDKMLDTINLDNLGLLIVTAHKYNADMEVKELAHKFFNENIQSLMEKESFRQIFFQNDHLFYP